MSILFILPADEMLDQWVSIGWIESEVRTYPNKEEMLEELDAYLKGLPEDAESLHKVDEINEIRKLIEDSIDKEDCVTIVANTADLRSFRPIAISAYENAIQRGLKADVALALAVKVVNILNESNIRESE